MIKIVTDLIAYRKAHGLSQEDFAKLVGYSLSAVQKWENGFRKPGERSKKAIRKVIY